MRTNAKLAYKRAQIAAKRLGTPITLNWTEWPDGEPVADPTTGAMLALPGSAPVEKSCTSKAMLHFVTPATTTVRLFGEIEIGDSILDLTAPLVRITAGGATALNAGDVVDLFALNAANRTLAFGQTPASGTEIEIDSLAKLSVTIDGQRWVQKNVGEALARSWDAIFAGLKLSRSILLRKAT